MNTQSLPVFIISCERSGSTMLRYIVDTHSKIACPSHLYLGNVLENLNRMILATVAQTQCGLDEDARNQFAIIETKEIISKIMSRYVEAKDKQFWCEKTPMNLAYLSLLNTHFPNAKYICLYRHCMDVVHSSINLSKYRFLPEFVPYVHRNPENIIAAMVENWLEKTEKLLEFESAHSAQCFRIKYEAIVSQPEVTLRSLFNFLEVEWEDGLIERVFHSAHDIGEGDGKAALSKNIRTNSIGKGVEIPKQGIPNKFLKDIDTLLDKLGYGSLDDYYSDNTKISLGKTKEMGDFDVICDIFEKRFDTTIKKNRSFYPTLDGIWKVIIDGEADKAWYIDLSNQKSTVNQNNSGENFTLFLPGSLLLDLVEGRRDAIEAFFQGEIQTSGIDDKELLMNFGRLLFS